MRKQPRLTGKVNVQIFPYICHGSQQNYLLIYKHLQEFEVEILRAHNEIRHQIGGMADLMWSMVLQDTAQQYSDFLSTELLFEHSGVAGQGENLWMGDVSTPPSNVVHDWGNEVRYFKYGVFPDVSTSGIWKDVGHYTQIIWNTTIYVGCGGTLGSDNNFRVTCRYSPPGNYIGEKVYEFKSQSEYLRIFKRT